MSFDKFSVSALKRSEEQYRTFFDEAPISLWEENWELVKQYIDRLKKTGVSNLRQYFDDNPETLVNLANMAKLVDVNQAALKLYHANTKEMFFNKFPNTFTQDSLNSFKEMILQFSDHEWFFKTETIDKTFNNTLIPLQMQGSLSYSSFDSWKNVLISIQDLTQRKKMEQSEQLIHSLQLSNQQLLDFTYVVSHDLKAPLLSTKLLVDKLLVDYDDSLSKDMSASLLQIEEKIEGMKKLILNILNYSMVELTDDDFEIIELNSLISEIFSILKDFKKVELVIDSKLPKLRYVKIRVYQLFQNLISNSIKYNDKDKGIITVKYDLKNTESCEFRVIDNGPGINPAEISRIFRMFKIKGHSSNFESTGFGLAIVKKVIDLWGGTIRIESKPGTGTEFIFTIPSNYCIIDK